MHRSPKQPDPLMVDLANALENLRIQKDLAVAPETRCRVMAALTVCLSPEVQAILSPARFLWSFDDRGGALEIHYPRSEPFLLALPNQKLLLLEKIRNLTGICRIQITGRGRQMHCEWNGSRWTRLQRQDLKP